MRQGHSGRGQSCGDGRAGRDDEALTAARGLRDDLPHIRSGEVRSRRCERLTVARGGRHTVGEPYASGGSDADWRRTLMDVHQQWDVPAPCTVIDNEPRTGMRGVHRDPLTRARVLQRQKNRTRSALVGPPSGYIPSRPSLGTPARQVTAGGRATPVEATATRQTIAVLPHRGRNAGRGDEHVIETSPILVFHVRHGPLKDDVVDVAGRGFHVDRREGARGQRVTVLIDEANKVKNMLIRVTRRS